MLIDSHAHLDFPDFAEDLEEVVARAQKAVAGMRDILLLEKFSQTDIAAWEKYQDAYLQNPLSVPGDVRPILTALEPWMTATVTDER